MSIEETDAWIKRSIVKTALVIAHSRVRFPIQRGPVALNDWGGLSLHELPQVVDQIEVLMNRSQGIYSKIQMDIFVHPNATQTAVLLERWSLHYEPEDMHVPRRKVDNKSFYRKILLLFRSLQSYARLLPAYQLYKRLLFEPNNASFTLSHQFSSSSASAVLDQQPGSFVFGSILTPCGKFNVSVLYRKEIDFDFVQPQPVMMDKFIIRDYVSPGTKQGPRRPEAPPTSSQFRRQSFDTKEVSSGISQVLNRIPGPILHSQDSRITQAGSVPARFPASWQPSTDFIAPGTPPKSSANESPRRTETVPISSGTPPNRGSPRSETKPIPIQNFSQRSPSPSSFKQSVPIDIPNRHSWRESAAPGSVKSPPFAHSLPQVYSDSNGSNAPIHLISQNALSPPFSHKRPESGVFTSGAPGSYGEPKTSATIIPSSTSYTNPVFDPSPSSVERSPGLTDSPRIDSKTISPATFNDFNAAQAVVAVQRPISSDFAFSEVVTDPFGGHIDPMSEEAICAFIQQLDLAPQLFMLMGSHNGSRDFTSQLSLGPIQSSSPPKLESGSAANSLTVRMATHDVVHAEIQRLARIREELAAKYGDAEGRQAELE